MKPRMLLSTLTVFVLACAALVAAAPATATETGLAQCPQYPLGEPDPENPGVDDHVKEFGNPVIYGGCVFVLTVAGDAVVLAVGVAEIAIGAANLVCDFATGNPCFGPMFQMLIQLIMDIIGQ